MTVELPQDTLDGDWFINWRLDDGRRTWMDRSLPIRYWPMTKVCALSRLQSQIGNTPIAFRLTVFFPAAYKQN
jgi:hypothetical protein